MMKGLVLALPPNANIEDVIQVAKAEALKIGFGNKELLRVVEAIHSHRINRWLVVVQDSGSERRRKKMEK